MMHLVLSYSTCPATANVSSMSPPPRAVQSPPRHLKHGRHPRTCSVNKRHPTPHTARFYSTVEPPRLTATAMASFSWPAVHLGNLANRQPSPLGRDCVLSSLHLACLFPGLFVFSAPLAVCEQAGYCASRLRGPHF